MEGHDGGLQKKGMEALFQKTGGKREREGELRGKRKGDYESS